MNVVNELVNTRVYAPTNIDFSEEVGHAMCILQKLLSIRTVHPAGWDHHYLKQTMVIACSSLYILALSLQSIAERLAGYVTFLEHKEIHKLVEAGKPT